MIFIISCKFDRNIYLFLPHFYQYFHFCWLVSVCVCGYPISRLTISPSDRLVERDDIMRIPLAKERKETFRSEVILYFLANLSSGYSRYISTQSVNPFFSPSLDNAISLTIVHLRPRPLVSHFDTRRSAYGCATSFSVVLQNLQKLFLVSNFDISNLLYNSRSF